MRADLPDARPDVPRGRTRARHLDHDERRAARPAAGPLADGRRRPRDGLVRLADAAPVRRDDPARRARQGPRRARRPRRRPASRRSRSTPWSSAGRTTTRWSSSRAGRARPATRCGSSSTCRSTPSTPGSARRSCPSAQILETIDAAFPLVAGRPRERARDVATRSPTARPARIGVIASVTEPFCDTCNRLRLTAEGQVRACLFSLEETDLRGPMRDGASDEELARLIRATVWREVVGAPHQPRRLRAAGAQHVDDRRLTHAGRRPRASARRRRARTPGSARRTTAPPRAHRRCLGLAEPVPLAFEQQIRIGHPLRLAARPR